MSMAGGTDLNGELTMELKNHISARIYSMLGTPTPQSEISLLSYQLELANKSVRELQAQVCDLQLKLQRADIKLQETNSKYTQAKEEALLNANALRRNIAACDELRQECELFRSDRDVFEEAMVEAEKQKALAESRAIEAEMREKAVLRRLEKLLQISPMKRNQRKHNGYLEELLQSTTGNKRTKLASTRLLDCEMAEENMAGPSDGQDSAKICSEGLLKSEHSPQRKKARNGELHQCNESPPNHYKLTSFNDDSCFHPDEAFAASGELEVEERHPSKKSVLGKLNPNTDDSSTVCETSEPSICFSTNHPRLTDKKMGATVSKVSIPFNLENQLKKEHPPHCPGQLEPRKKAKEGEQDQCSRLITLFNDSSFHVDGVLATAGEHEVEERRSLKKRLRLESKHVSADINAVEQTSQPSTSDLESTNLQSGTSAWKDVEQLKSALKICQQNLLKSEIEGAMLYQKNKVLKSMILEILSPQEYTC